MTVRFHDPVWHDGCALVHQLEAAFRLANGLNWERPDSAGSRQAKRYVEAEPFIDEADAVGGRQVLEGLQLPGPRRTMVIQVPVLGAGRHAGKIKLDGEVELRLARQIVEHIMNLDEIGTRLERDLLADLDRGAGSLPGSRHRQNDAVALSPNPVVVTAANEIAQLGRTRPAQLPARDPADTDAI